MGKLVVFRREADPVPTDATGNTAIGSSGNKDWPEALDTEFSPNLRGPNLRGETSGSWAVYRRRELPGFVRSPNNASPRADLDGYLLVLLADQELVAGRDQQAQTLLDAAYAAFDRETHTALDCAANR